MFRNALSVITKGEGDIVNLTEIICQSVKDSSIQNGLCSVFISGSTAAITTIEYESGALQDLLRSLSILAPDTIEYAHDSRWGDGNGRSHVKAALVGPSLTIPVINGKLMLGTWQQIVLLELDIRKQRERTIYVSIVE